jgi:peptidyl-prolyl cis-trans isomerase C
LQAFNRAFLPENTMQRTVTALTFAIVLIAADCLAQATKADDEVLAENAQVKLTRADYETDLLRIPPQDRLEFAGSPRRLTSMLNNLLVDKTLAKQARDAGLDRDPEIARRLALEVDRFYAQAMLGKVELDAAAEFDAKQDDFLRKAREMYLLDKDKYNVPEQVNASHILFDTKKRSDEAARALATETRAKLVAGADFGKLAKQLSDDPGSGGNGGEVGWFPASGKMDPDFSAAAFALKNVGDLSEPVHSSFGWHIIRLDGRRPAHQLPFDRASKLIMFDLKQHYMNDAKTARVAAITNDPSMKVNQAAIDALVMKYPGSQFSPFPPGKKQ